MQQHAAAVAVSIPMEIANFLLDHATGSATCEEVAIGINRSEDEVTKHATEARRPGLTAMALTDFIYDQRLDIRRPPVPARAVHHTFRVRLSDKTEHVVSAACAEDATLHVQRRNPGKRIVSTFVDGGKE